MTLKPLPGPARAGLAGAAILVAGLLAGSPAAAQAAALHAAAATSVLTG